VAIVLADVKQVGQRRVAARQGVSAGEGTGEGVVSAPDVSGGRRGVVVKVVVHARL
jgi:hypothetical protein